MESRCLLCGVYGEGAAGKEVKSINIKYRQDVFKNKEMMDKEFGEGFGHEWRGVRICGIKDGQFALIESKCLICGVYGEGTNDDNIKVINNRRDDWNNKVTADKEFEDANRGFKVSQEAYSK